MSNEALAQSYFAAWNAHDAAAILETLGTDGTYADPGTRGPIRGTALTAYVSGLFAAYPDLSFETRSHAATGPDGAAAQWVMRGTNTGSMNGLPPTGRAVELPGADFFTFADGHIASVTGYFDSSSVPRQLGLDVIVQPKQVGPFRFGSSVVVQTGRTDLPGVVSLTHLEVSGPEEADRVTEISRRTLIAMLGMEGFLGATTSKVGNRMVTISTWTDAEAAHRLLAEPNHAEGMRELYSGKLGSAGRITSWTAGRDHGLYLRCTACGKMHRNVTSDTACTCGAALPPPIPYW